MCYNYSTTIKHQTSLSSEIYIKYEMGSNAVCDNAKNQISDRL